MTLIPRRLIARIAHRQVLAKVLDNIAWLALDKALKLGIILVVMAWLARYLGPEDFGTYNYVIAFVTLFGSLATFGLPTIVVRELVREPALRAEILGTSALLLTLGGLVAVGVAALVAGWIRPDDSISRIGVVVVAASLVFQGSAVVRYWFESQVTARHLVIPENLALLVGAGVRIILILKGAPFAVFFWILLLEAVLFAVFLPVAYAWQMGDLRRWYATRERALHLMRDGWPLALAGVITVIQARLDQVVLSEMAGDQELGYYSVALRIAESLVFFSLALQSSIFPVLVDARRESIEVFRRKLLEFYRVTLLVAFVICVPVALLGPWLVHWLFGPAYDPAGVLLSLMAGRIFLAFIGVARSVYLTIENMQRYATLTVAIGTVLNLLLNFLWIPSYQAIGSVLASLVSFAVTSLIIDFFVPRVRGNAFDIVRAILTPHRIGRR